MIKERPLTKSASTKRQSLLRWLLLLYIVSIIIVSLLPSDLMPPTNISNFDKVEHFLVYTGLGFLVGLTFVTRNGRFTAILGVICLGFLLEVCQSFIPGRAMSLADALADTAGILLGLLLSHYWLQPVTAWLDRHLT